jgi:hypothetical protein
VMASAGDVVRRGERRLARLPRVASAGLLIGMAAMAAGCTPSAEPSPLPTPTVSAAPSPSATPSETPPTMPSAAHGTSPKAAKAFVRHYFDLINYAARTGDTKELRRLGTHDCVSCEAIASNIEKIYDAGGHIKSDGWKVTVVSPVPAQPRRSPILDVGIIQSPESVVERAGAAAKSFPGGKKPMTIYLVKRAFRWNVDRLDLVSS